MIPLPRSWHILSLGKVVGKLVKVLESERQDPDGAFKKIKLVAIQGMILEGVRVRQ